MKKKISIIAILILLCGICYAQTRYSTDRLTGNRIIFNGECLLFGCFVETDGTNNVTLTLYDGGTTAEKMMRKIIVPGSNYYGGFELPEGLECSKGLFATISGTGGAYWVTYRSKF